MNKVIPHPFLEWRHLDADSGMVMPWYTKPCLDWLKSYDVSKWSVFEYGCGLSTLWWRFNAEFVKSIDSDCDWADKIKYVMQTPIKQFYLYGPFDNNMLKNPTPFYQYDAIIIDGIYRDECTAHALKCIKPGGYIIIDNYHQASADLPESEWTRTDELLKEYPVVIFAQEGHPDWKTAVFQIVK